MWIKTHRYINSTNPNYWTQLSLTFHKTPLCTLIYQLLVLFVCRNSSRKADEKLEQHRISRASWNRKPSPRTRSGTTHSSNTALSLPAPTRGGRDISHYHPSRRSPDRAAGFGSLDSGHRTVLQPLGQDPYAGAISAQVPTAAPIQLSYGWYERSYRPAGNSHLLLQ